MNKSLLKTYGPYGLLVIFFVTVAFFRPLFPVDETRYMTVAWEMFLHKQYAVLSLNFEPYHHKPPLLFWLINLVWSLLGVSRWSALLPIFAISASVLFLTKKVGELLFPQECDLTEKLPWMMLGTAPFLIYGSLIMFDMLVCALLLGILMTFLHYATTPKRSYILIGGLLLGLGILAKGPVMALYTLWPLVFYPCWRKSEQIAPCRLYKAVGISVLLSLFLVALWLIPALMHTGNDFAFWLVWNQTAGRVSGNFSSAHVRPFYFYILLIPALFLPWLFFPELWRGRKNWSLDNRSIRFILTATIPTFICFSVIAGKQPHYLLPLLPFIVIALNFMMKDVQWYFIARISSLLVILLIVGQIAAASFIFSKYDLTPYADFYDTHIESDWAYVGKYQGELGFIGRLTKPMGVTNKEELSEWFTTHPGGYALLRYEHPEEIKDYALVFSQEYRGRNLGILQERQPHHDK